MNYKYISIGLLIIIIVLVIYILYTNYNYNKKYISGIWELDKNISETINNRTSKYYLIIPEKKNSDGNYSIIFLNIDSSAAKHFNTKLNFPYLSFTNEYTINANFTLKNENDEKDNNDNEKNKLSDFCEDILPDNCKLIIDKLDGSMNIISNDKSFGIFYKNNMMQQK